MCEKCAPFIPVTRLLGLSGFGYDAGCIEAAVSDDKHEIMSLGRFLIWKYAAVCGGRVWLNICVNVWSDMWKSHEREFAIMFCYFNVLRIYVCLVTYKSPTNPTSYGVVRL